MPLKLYTEIEWFILPIPITAYKSTALEDARSVSNTS